jgi:uncharacterized membrane protein
VSARSTSSDEIRAAVWFWPLVGVAASLVATLALLAVRPAPGGAFAQRAWPTDASTASAVLQTVATAAMTAASLSFSLTVVALQLASQQFSPRLLRGFARDRVIQLTMGLLVSAFVVSLTTLRGLDPERPLPVLALVLSLGLGLASAVVLLVFIGHLIRALRVDTMMRAVHQDTRRSIRAATPCMPRTPSAPGRSCPGRRAARSCRPAAAASCARCSPSRSYAVSAQDADQRAALEHQLDLVLAQVSDDLLDDDVAAVHDLARRVWLALSGDVDDAYRDRAGETRSI